MGLAIDGSGIPVDGLHSSFSGNQLHGNYLVFGNGEAPTGDAGDGHKEFGTWDLGV